MSESKVGWTKAEYDQCPELAGRLHSEILDLCAERDQAQAALHSCQERERVLREALGPLAPRKHDTACPRHMMHDELYEGPGPDEWPLKPRVCDCGFDAARVALSDFHRSEGDE